MKKLILFIMILSVGLMAQSVGGAGSANQTTHPGDVLINGKIILENIDEFTEEDSPAVGDSVLVWDVTADALVRVSIDKVLDLAGVAAFEIDQLTEETTPVLTDTIAMWDVTADAHRRVEFEDMFSMMVGGEGLSYTRASATFDLDFDNLAEDTPVATDSMAFWDITADAHKLMVVADLSVDGVVITGGEGISNTAGTVDLDFDNLGEVAIAATDSIAFWDITGDVHGRAVAQDVADLFSPTPYTGGEGISVDAFVINMDIDNLATDNPAIASDSLLFWDASEAEHAVEDITTILALMTHDQAETILDNEDFELGTGDFAATEITVGTIFTLEPNSGSTTPAVYANDASIASTSSIMRIGGDGAPVILDADTAIDDGAYDGQILILHGADDTNTLTLFDGVNTSLQGGVNFTFGDKDQMLLQWDDDDSNWQEISRADN